MALIRLQDVSVRFQLYDAFHRSFKQRIFGNTFAGEKNPEINNKIYVDALTNVDLELVPGDRVAVFGGNGSGKTTLLRVLAGMLVPNSGRADIIGNAAPVLNIGYGFGPELTVRDTICLKGILLGHDNEEIRRVISDIASFASIEDALDFPLVNLPNGLVIALAIAMSLFFEAEIIIWDDILESLDYKFYEKIKSYLNKSSSRAPIIVIADRSKSFLDGFCNKALILEKGRLVSFEDYSEISAQWGDNFS